MKKILLVLITILFIGCDLQVEFEHTAIAPIDSFTHVSLPFNDDVTSIITSKGTFVFDGYAGYIPIGDTLYYAKRFIDGVPSQISYITWDKLNYKSIDHPQVLGK